MIKRNDGQSLVEVVIAMAVAVVIVVALVGLTITSLRNAQVSKMQNAATRYSQQALELLREIRDRDWVSFEAKAGPGIGLLYKLGENDELVGPVAPCGPEFNIGNQFLRCVGLIREVEGVMPNVKVIIRARVFTQWKDARGDHSSFLETVFSDPSKWGV